MIEQLDIKGAVVTIDAAGCYTEIVDAVVDNKGHYLVTLKENQPTLMSETKEVFAEVESKDFEGVACYRESNRGHGRVEERTYYAVPLPAESELRERWKNLNTLMMGIFEREVKGKRSREVRYMIRACLHLIFHSDGDVCDGNEGIVRFIQFVISREHSPELLDIAEVTFYIRPVL